MMSIGACRIRIHNTEGICAKPTGCTGGRQPTPVIIPLHDQKTRTPGTVKRHCRWDLLQSGTNLASPTSPPSSAPMTTRSCGGGRNGGGCASVAALWSEYSYEQMSLSTTWGWTSCAPTRSWWMWQGRHWWVPPQQLV